MPRYLLSRLHRPLNKFDLKTPERGLRCAVSLGYLRWMLVPTESPSRLGFLSEARDFSHFHQVDQQMMMAQSLPTLGLSRVVEDVVMCVVNALSSFTRLFAVLCRNLTAERGHAPARVLTAGKEGGSFGRESVLGFFWGGRFQLLVFPW